MIDEPQEVELLEEQQRKLAAKTARNTSLRRMDALLIEQLEIIKEMIPQFYKVKKAPEE